MSPPWMPLYVGDYMADTGHLRTIEHGAYLLLIMHYWRTGGLPDDDRALARIARLSGREWRRTRPVLAPLFSDGWRHKRIEFELTEAARISAIGKQGGIASGAARRAAREALRANGRSTGVEQRGQQIGNEREPLQPPPPSLSSKEDKGAGAPVIPIDAKAKLFSVGRPTLIAMGVSDGQAGEVIGKWLKDHDAKTILFAISEADAQRAHNPIPYINTVLGNLRTKQHVGNRPSLSSICDDLLARQKSRAGAGAGADQDHARLLG